MVLFFNLIIPLTCYSLTASLIAVYLSLDPLTATGVGALFAAPFLLWLYQKERGMWGKTADSFFIPAKFWIFPIALGITVCIMVNNIISISPVPALFPEYLQVSERLFTPPVWIQIAAMGFLIPAVEELIFRGLIGSNVRMHLAFWPSAVISSVLFGIYHGNAAQGIYAFVLGLFLAWVLERYGTLLAPYLFHSAANTASVLLTAATTDEQNRSILFFQAGTVLSVCLTVVFVRLIVKNTYPKEEIT